MISVCIPTFNGAHYIGDQLSSILQSSLVTEVIVSDDGSADDTLEIVRSFRDDRIKIFIGPSSGLVKNIEYLLSLTSGDYIFLADQDDIWFPSKVEVMLSYIQKADMVICDCMVVDTQLNIVHPSFFTLRKSGKGLLKNLMRNSYLGCCLAFRRSLLEYALPFPVSLPMHDWWLGLIAESFGKVIFINEPLIMYRRHGKNFSSTAERSYSTWRTRIYWRYSLLSSLIKRKLNSL